jgi:hypothetical protein
MVEKADHRELAQWYRFLPSPGISAIGEEWFRDTMREEGKIMDRIRERFQEMGGMTSAISKEIGW